MLQAEDDGSRDFEKLSLIRPTLAARVEGDYEPVEAGPDVCAFVRGGRWLVVAVLRDAGLDAEIDGRRVRDLTDGRSYALLDR